MSIKRPVSWFLTEAGRKTTCVATLAASTGALLINFAPETFGLSKYIDIVHLYKSGMKQEVSPVIMERFNKCVDILNINGLQKTILQPFHVFGYDLFHAGVYSSRFGIFIGIPDNFNFNSKEDIDQDGIQVNLKPVNWTSEAGQKLEEALVLPEKVQMFGICREIMMTQTRHLFINSLCPCFIILGTYLGTRRLNEKMNLYARPVGLRMVAYSLISIFSTGLYFMCKDVAQVHYETRTDEKLADLGQDFIESGIEFYDKQLKRNMALRYFLGKEGENLYSIKGNENFLLRHKRVPLTARRDYFELRLKQLQEKGTNEETIAS